MRTVAEPLSYSNPRMKAAIENWPSGSKRTFKRSDGSIGCDECCNGDRCDDRTHHDRDNCPFCLGSGTPGDLSI